MSAYCEELIVCEERRGVGIEGDPVRTVTVVRRKNGDGLAEHDSLAPVYQYPKTPGMPGGFAFGGEGSASAMVMVGGAPFWPEQLRTILTGAAPDREDLARYRESVRLLLHAVERDEPVEVAELRDLCAAVHAAEDAL